MNLIVRRKHTHKKNTSACLCSILKKGSGGCQSVGQTIMANCGKKKYSLPSEQIFLSGMALAFTKSFASLVSRVVGLFYTPRGQQPKSSFQTATLPALFQQSYVTLRELAGVGE